MNIIKDLFIDNKKSLIFVYLLFIAESVLLLSYPLVLGKTIDKIIESQYYYVINLILVLGGFMTTAYFRRIYDTKVFTTIYRKTVLKYINKEIKNGKDTSVINARSNMLRSIVDFLEVDFPYIFHAVFSIFGAVIIIMINYNLIIGIFVGLFIIPILFTSRYFSKKLSIKYSQANDLYEMDVNILDTCEERYIRHHFINKNLLQIKISAIDAKNNLSNELINYSLIILSLIMFTIFESVTVGAIMSLYQYILRFTNGAFMIPSLTIRYVNLKDIISRISKA